MSNARGRWTRREALKAVGASALALPWTGWSAWAEPGGENPVLRRFAPWLNQRDGHRPVHAWENCEDLIYHDLRYDDPEVQNAPEFCAFCRRVWVFNRAMRWRRDADTGLIVCHCGVGDLPLTGEREASVWHSDAANLLESDGAATRFVKRSGVRQRDCAVLPAFQFPLGQYPVLALAVRGATCDWQFCVGIKGRSGPPMLSSGWQRGAGTFRWDVAAALRRRGYGLNHAQVHLAMGLWTASLSAEGEVRYEARLLAQPAVVPCLPVVRTAARVAQDGLPLAAVVLDGDGQTIAAGRVKVRARVAGQEVLLSEDGGLWRGKVRGVGPGEYAATLSAEGVVRARAVLQVRVTDGQFAGYDRERHLVLESGRPVGPLSGSYAGTTFFRDVGRAGERMILGQRDWDRWNRAQAPGEHLHYWEALTPGELDRRFAWLRECGWDLLHLCQHWGVWARLDAGGRISPHGAEQLALYLRTAARHGLRVFQALTHYPYMSPEAASGAGTVPFSTYLASGFRSDQWFAPADRPFDRLFHQYLRDYASLFRDETALFALTASGEGDAVMRERALDIRSVVQTVDAQHLVAGEPIHTLRELPARQCAGWPHELRGCRTYAIGAEALPEFDLGVDFKFQQLGRLYLAEGSWAAPPGYVQFHHALAGATGADPWTGTNRYRLRLRDTLYLGLVHRIPVLMTWDEQIAEDEHRVLRQAARAVDWSQPFAAPGVCLRVDDRCATGPGRLNLTRWEAAFARLPLMCGLLEPDSPAPPGAPLVLDGSAPAPDLLLRSAGGPLPDELAERAPLRLAPGYAASYAWSADARTLLAYVYNVADHEDVPASYDLSGRYHRLPQPTALRLALCGFPGGALRARLYDLNRQALHREMRFARDASLDLGKTDRDYLLLVTP